MTWYEILLVIHIVFMAIWFGAGVGVMLVGNQLQRIGDVGTFTKFCASLEKLGGPMFGGSSLVVLLSGIGMVARDGAPEFSDLWVSLGFAGWLVTAVLGAVVVGKSWAKIGHELAESGATFESVAPALRRARFWSWVDTGLRVAVIVDMVWKPL
jgi:uncharacterized membrane protein